MSMDKLRIGFIGAGNMAAALMGGLIRSRTARPENILASDLSSERREQVVKELKVAVTDDNTLVYDKSDVIIVCVKPAQVKDVLGKLAAGKVFPGSSRKIVISIAAGIRIRSMEEVLYKDLNQRQRASLPIFRVMPNTPALVGAGISALAGNGFANGPDGHIAERILRAVGRVLTLPEDSFDAVTAVSGSGPAYAFYLAEAMIRAGESLGLSSETARELSVATIEGAGRLMESSQDPPELLRARVTSPGGTTQEAITVMEQRGVHDAVVAALKAAARRSRELSGR